MEISVLQAEENNAVTILRLKGALDASNFEAVIDQAKSIYASGNRQLILDMSEVNFMSSSGLVALHSIALLMRGEELHDLESGWNVFHAIESDLESGVKSSVKILGPQPKVASTLRKTGMDQFFNVYEDIQAAVASF